MRSIGVLTVLYNIFAEPCAWHWHTFFVVWIYRWQIRKFHTYYCIEANPYSNYIPNHKRYIVEFASFVYYISFAHRLVMRGFTIARNQSQNKRCRHSAFVSFVLVTGLYLLYCQTAADPIIGFKSIGFGSAASAFAVYLLRPPPNTQ